MSQNSKRKNFPIAHGMGIWILDKNPHSSKRAFYYCTSIPRLYGYNSLAQIPQVQTHTSPIKPGSVGPILLILPASIEIPFSARRWGIEAISDVLSWTKIVTIWARSKGLVQPRQEEEGKATICSGPFPPSKFFFLVIQHFSWKLQ